LQGKPELNDGFSQEDKDAFSVWYTGGICSAVVPMRFDWNADRDLHVFDSTDYIPLDTEPRGLFTSEINVFFQYNGGEVFDFRGDDDVWVFVNGELVLDIGGCHSALSASLSLDSVAERLGLEQFKR
jgi:fibro-slime domain-containing protein